MPAQIPFDLPARTSLARDDLVASEANALAIGAIDTWPDWPHPVLVVAGPPGAGKTHIAAAWGERASAVRFDDRAELPATPFAVRRPSSTTEPSASTTVSPST